MTRRAYQNRQAQAGFGIRVSTRSKMALAILACAFFTLPGFDARPSADISSEPRFVDVVGARWTSSGSVDKSRAHAEARSKACVEGWSVIGKWTGVPLRHVLSTLRPLPAVRYLVFHCADPMDGSDVQAPGSTYYESIDLAEALHPQTILAYALNGEPLPVKNGAPLRLRVERQLGYK
jgi:hypothetical protein